MQTFHSYSTWARQAAVRGLQISWVGERAALAQDGQGTFFGAWFVNAEQGYLGSGRKETVR